METLGYWQPSKELVKIDAAKLKSWVAKGAKITKAVSVLLKGAK